MTSVPQHQLSPQVTVFQPNLEDPEVSQTLRSVKSSVVLVAPEMPSPVRVAQFAPATAAHIEVLNQRLESLAGVANSAVASSPRVSNKLQTLGFKRVSVAAPPVEVGHLHDAEVSIPTQNHLRRFGTPQVFLATGPILPDARIEKILAANAVLVNSLLPKAQLVVAGPAPIFRYLECCEHYTRELNTDQTWLATQPTLSECASFLRAANAVMHFDESDRFPREAIEAMSFGIPIIGRVGSVLHELTPEAGLFLADEDGPVEIAEAMALLISEPTLRNELGRQARRAATIFTSPDAQLQYRRRLLELAS